VKVNWTLAAQKHLFDIFEYIAADSEIYAQRMINRLTRHSEQIGEFPMSGRIVPEYDLPDIREIIEPPYRIIFIESFQNK